MHRFRFGPLSLLILLTPLWAQDQPKGERPATGTAEYKALAGEYAKAENDAAQAYKRAQTDVERQKLRAAYLRTRSAFFGRFLAFAEAHPKGE